MVTRCSGGASQLSAENQRTNARAACKALAPSRSSTSSSISHGNGPQVGLLALQGSAYTAVDTYPLDVLDAQTEGMIGYMLEQELGNELPFDRHLATLLTMIEVDRDDPAFGHPTKPIGPSTTPPRPSGSEREGLVLHGGRRQHAPRGALACAQADLRDPRDPDAARTGLSS